MRQLLNTLYVTTQGAYLHLDHETIVLELEGKRRFQAPLHHLGAVVCFGNILVSPALIHRCAEDGRTLVFLDRHGRFKARITGPTTGNVLLRQAQYRVAAEAARSLAVARCMVAGKLRNGRTILLRGAREASTPEGATALREAANALATSLSRLPGADTLDVVRGLEGEAARRYFEHFDRMIRVNQETFRFRGRTRRPPQDPINALLSFLYTLLRADYVAAAEGVGLDPQVGFLHEVRPGRPALALDLMEELRPILADRLALTLINRRQVTPDDFEERPGGAVYLNDRGRKTVVVAYQERKQEEVQHEVLEQKVPLGLIPHIQARLLARHLRGDMKTYLPFVYR